MGMFDRVWVKCPDCGRSTDLQSKASVCQLNDWTLDSAPLNVLEDLYAGGGYTDCDHCKYPISFERERGKYFVREFVLTENENDGFKFTIPKSEKRILSLEERLARLEHELDIKD